MDLFPLRRVTLHQILLDETNILDLFIYEKIIFCSFGNLIVVYLGKRTGKE